MRAAITSWLIGATTVAQLGFLADLGQHDEQASQSFFARIEQLIDEVRLDLAVAQQEERNEPFRQFAMVV